MSGREITAALLIPVMKLTGFRFSKEYRHEITRFHSLVYNCVDTVGANCGADGMKPWRASRIMADMIAEKRPPITNDDPFAGM